MTQPLKPEAFEDALAEVYQPEKKNDEYHEGILEKRGRVVSDSIILALAGFFITVGVLTLTEDVVKYLFKRFRG